MNNYEYCVPTDIRFGKGQVECLAKEIGKYGKKVLLVYGGGSIKKSGLYDKIYEILADFDIFELSGIEPNPKLSSVKQGAEICKEQKIDVVLAVGGGSSIDASKHIACAAFYDGDPWDLVLNKSLVTKALPIFTVLTICATGSEMNPGAVISNEYTKEKLEINHYYTRRYLYVIRHTCLHYPKCRQQQEQRILYHTFLNSIFSPMMVHISQTDSVKRH